MRLQMAHMRIWFAPTLQTGRTSTAQDVNVKQILQGPNPRRVGYRIAVLETDGVCELQLQLQRSLRRIMRTAWKPA